MSSARRIEHYLAEIDADHGATQLRPTEAQLRWAALHAAARARHTRRAIDRLMGRPPDVSDVDGARSSDGDTTIGVDDDDDDESDYAPGDRGAGDVYDRSSPLLDSPESDSGNRKAYLGTRRDRQGKWVRRHFSRTRFPHVAAKAMRQHQSSSVAATNAAMEEGEGERCESSDHAARPARRRAKREKARISKGRRALLRVSKRAYEDRKQKKTAQPFKLDSIGTASTFQSANTNSTSYNDYCDVYTAGNYNESRLERKIENATFEEEFCGPFTESTGETSGGGSRGRSRRRQSRSVHSTKRIPSPGASPQDELCGAFDESVGEADSRGSRSCTTAGSTASRGRQPRSGRTLSSITNEKEVKETSAGGSKYVSTTGSRWQSRSRHSPSSIMNENGESETSIRRSEGVMTVGLTSSHHQHSRPGKRRPSPGANPIMSTNNPARGTLEDEFCRTFTDNSRGTGYGGCGDITTAGPTASRRRQPHPGHTSLGVTNKNEEWETIRRGSNATTAGSHRKSRTCHAPSSMMNGNEESERSSRGSNSVTTTGPHGESETSSRGSKHVSAAGSHRQSRPGHAPSSIINGNQRSETSSRGSRCVSTTGSHGESETSSKGSRCDSTTGSHRKSRPGHAPSSRMNGNEESEANSRGSRCASTTGSRGESETDSRGGIGYTSAGSHRQPRPGSMASSTISENGESETNFKGSKGDVAALSTALSHRRIITSENESRIRRFQEAYNAIMLATNANWEDDEAAAVSALWLDAGGKRWTRDPNIASAVSIDGKMYDDMQRTPTVSLRQMKAKDGYNHAELLDRAATWLVHIPTNPRNWRLSSVDEENYPMPGEAPGRNSEVGEEPPVSACHQKLSDIESKIRLIDNGSNLGPLQNPQVTPLAQASPSPMKRLSIHPKVKRGEDDGPLGHGRREKSIGNLSKKLTNIRSEDCNIDEREAEDSKSSNIDFTPSAVRITALQRLFAGVRNETKGGAQHCVDNPPARNRRATKPLVRPFAGVVSKETKGANRFIYSPPIGRGAMRTSVRPTETDRATARGEVEGGADCVVLSCAEGIYDQDLATEGKEADTGAIFAREKGPMDAVCVSTRSGVQDGPGGNAEENGSTRTIQLEPSRGDDIDTVVHEELDKRSWGNEDISDDHIDEGQHHVYGGIFDSISDQSHLNVEYLIRESLATRLPSVIDTDGTESDFSGLDEEQYAAKMRSMLMSPSLITKRYQQALNAIEGRNWNQITSLINANPWLMEMEDVRNEQSVVHSLSLFGGGGHDADCDSPDDSEPLPKKLVQNIIDYVPTVVHKLDIEGNLPLHMAAASGNIVMIRELGQRFSGAASVQNHNGLLPLHLAVMSCALFPTGDQSVELILALFPGAVCVKDTDGNTPLHIAAGTLRGDVGAGVIDQLMQCCRASMLENGVSLEENITYGKNSMLVTEAASTTSVPTGTSPDDLGVDQNNFYILKNKKGETPLARAIKSLAGRQVVEALLVGYGGQVAALNANSASQNALHLALSSEFYDAAVILSILKSSPSSATVEDGKGMLPIQLACLNSVQHEIILAIAIVDLPIDLGAKEEAILRNGYGASWWYLLCESDDMYVNVVEEILSLCSHPQKVALCLTQEGKKDDSRTASACATPQCKLELRRCLRFFGRFEFVGGGGGSHSRHVQKFDALDYGPHESQMQDGKKVTLYCYPDAEGYRRDAEHLQCSELDTKLFEDLCHFPVGDMEANVPSGVSLQYCVAVNKPILRLASVIDGMPNGHRYRSDSAILVRYFSKSRSIMRQIAKALRELHAANIIHGQVDSSHIGKFGERWKITGLPGSTVTGELFATSRLGLHSPPEAYILANSKHSDRQSIASLAPFLKAEPAVDVWAFGKLMYEIFVGESLFAAFSERGDSVHTSKCILTWNDGHLRELSNKLFEERIGSTGADLISCCLYPMKSARTRSMSDILQHPFWTDKNAFNFS